MYHGKTHYFDLAIFNSYVQNYQRACSRCQALGVEVLTSSILVPNLPKIDIQKLHGSTMQVAYVRIFHAVY